MSNRTRSRNAWESQLTNLVTSGATSFDVDDATGLTAPLYLVLAPTDATKREYIKVGAINTNTLSSVTRDLDGSATGGPFEHAAGTKVRAVPAHQHLDDIFDDIEALETQDAGHAHTGADGSSTVTHADTTGKTANDHHAQDHAARHAPGGADALDITAFEVDGFERGTTLLPDGTYQAVVTVTLDIPATWNSWKCIATATYQVQGKDGHYETRIVIDGVAGDEKFARTGEEQPDTRPSDQDGAINWQRTGITTTGLRDITLEVREVQADVNSINYPYLYARAVRTS